jgi:hypothetical protein
MSEIDVNIAEYPTRNEPQVTTIFETDALCPICKAFQTIFRKETVSPLQYTMSETRPLSKKKSP